MRSEEGPLASARRAENGRYCVPWPPCNSDTDIFSYYEVRSCGSPRANVELHTLKLD